VAIARPLAKRKVPSSDVTASTDVGPAKRPRKATPCTDGKAPLPAAAAAVAPGVCSGDAVTVEGGEAGHQAGLLWFREHSLVELTAKGAADAVFGAVMAEIARGQSSRAGRRVSSSLGSTPGADVSHESVCAAALAGGTAFMNVTRKEAEQ
jgi:hypothetical protein